MLYRFSRWRPLRRNYVRFQICWCSSLQKVRVYHQTKFRSYNSIHSWHITISGLEKQTSAILELYFRFRFRPYHRSWRVILYQSRKFIQIGRKMTLCQISRWRISAILNFRGSMASLKSPCRISYRWSIETIALNCLVFLRKLRFCVRILATDRQTDEQIDKPNALSRLRYRERRLNTAHAAIALRVFSECYVVNAPLLT